MLADGATSFIYGLGGTPIEQIDGAGNVLYYHHDQQGSTRALTNAAGQIVATYAYNGYGLLTAQTGTATTPLGYDGQLTDVDTGLIYLRARVYDPTTQQFLTRDPDDAQTRQAYAYADDDPVMLSDPTGLCASTSASCDWGAIKTGASGTFHGAEDVGEWVYDHPEQAAGLALGVVSITTGVGGLLHLLGHGPDQAVSAVLHVDRVGQGLQDGRLIPTVADHVQAS